MSFLNILGKKKTGSTYIGVTISSRAVLEAVQYDIATGNIINYAVEPLDFNQATRRVGNPAELENKIKAIFANLNADPATPVIVSVPTPLFQHQNLPISLKPAEIKTALTAVSEKNYLFKKFEPAVSWKVITESSDNSSQFLLFSAAIKEEIALIEKTFDRLGYNLIAIDTSYASLIRGLDKLGMLEDNIKRNKSWSILVVTGNSIVILSAIGAKLIDVQESPLATKALSQNDLYSVIVSNSSDVLKQKNPEHVIVVSESDNVSAELLSSSFNLPFGISFVEINSLAGEALFSGVDQAISPEVVGAACWENSNFELNFNFTSEERQRARFSYSIVIKGQEVNITKPFLEKVLAIGVVGIVLIMLILNGIFSGTLNSTTKKYKELASKNKIVKKTEIPQAETSIVDVINDIIQQNKKINSSYKLIADEIPEKLWINYFSLDDSMKANISGSAYSVDDIVGYYQKIAKLAGFINFKIAFLKVEKNSTPQKNVNRRGDNSEEEKLDEPKKLQYNFNFTSSSKEIKRGRR